MVRKSKNIFDVVKRQAEIKADIRVIGCDDYYKLFPKRLNIGYGGVTFLRNLSAKKYLEKLVDVNSNHTYERGLIGLLLDAGCVLEQLEVETTTHPEWGKMVWKKRHQRYKGRISDTSKSLYPKWPNRFIKAVFETEKAGEQEFSLCSTNASGHFHKSLVYHKAVFSSPKGK